MVRKPLIRGEADGGFGTFLAQTHIAAERMEEGSKHQGMSQAKRIRKLLRQGRRLNAPRQPLLRIAQTPQCPSGVAVANHTNILPIEERRGAVLPGVVECYA